MNTLIVISLFFALISAQYCGNFVSGCEDNTQGMSLNRNAFLDVSDNVFKSLDMTFNLFSASGCSGTSFAKAILPYTLTNNGANNYTFTITTPTVTFSTSDISSLNISCTTPITAGTAYNPKDITCTKNDQNLFEPLVAFATSPSVSYNITIGESDITIGDAIYTFVDTTGCSVHLEVPGYTFLYCIYAIILIIVICIFFIWMKDKKNLPKV
ncbi:hypothetical protein WA158_005631 [Blastocystis sp. Blastoise]